MNIIKSKLKINIIFLLMGLLFNNKIKAEELINKNHKKLPLTESNLKKVLIDNDIQHPHIVLAQAKLETGNFSSKVCKLKNNLFGLKKGNVYRSFKHWSDSVKAYKQLIQSRYKSGDYFKFLNKIGYAGDKKYISKLKSIIA